MSAAVVCDQCGQGAPTFVGRSWYHVVRADRGVEYDLCSDECANKFFGHRAHEPCGADNECEVCELATELIRVRAGEVP